MTSEVATAGGRFVVSPHACFACGELNAHGLHLQLHVADEVCWTETTLRPDFQGWEGIAHGGIVATLLDEVMAWALASHGAWAVTARMAIEYKRPIPVGSPIRGEGRIVERRRRLLTTAGRLVDPASGEVYATAEGLYVTVPDARRAELQARYDFRLVPEGAPGADPVAAPGADPSTAAPEGRPEPSPDPGPPAAGRRPAAPEASLT